MPPITRAQLVEFLTELVNEPPSDGAAFIALLDDAIQSRVHDELQTLAAGIQAQVVQVVTTQVTQMITSQAGQDFIQQQVQAVVTSQQAQTFINNQVDSRLQQVLASQQFRDQLAALVTAEIQNQLP